MKLTSLNRFRLIILGISIVLVVTSYRPAGQIPDHLVYDFATWLMPTRTLSHNKIITIAITGKDLEQYGPWPWSRHRIARMLDIAGKQGARRIGLLLRLDTPQTPELMPRIREELEASPDIRPIAGRLLKIINTDDALTRSIKRNRHVFLAASWHEKPGVGPIDNQLTELAITTTAPQSGIRYLASRPPRENTGYIRPPLPIFIKAAAGTGISMVPARFRRARSSRLAYNADKYLLPSFALLMARGNSKNNLQLLNRFMADNYRIRPLPSGQGLKDRPFYRYSASELLQGKIRTSQLRGSIILIGTELPQTDAYWKLPGGISASPLFREAITTAAIINRNAVKVPDWFYLVQRTLLLAFALYLLLMPSRLHGKFMLILNLGMALAMLNAAIIILLTQKLWLPLSLPAIFLLVMQIVISMRHRVVRKIDSLSYEAGHIRYQLATNLQSQGQLDLAFEQLRQSPPNDDTLTALYQLGLDFERRRQYSKALEAYHIIARHDTEWRDVNDRISKLGKLASPVMGEIKASPAATIMVDDPEIENPRLGRFDIEHELGRGAMGMVYLAIDPDIERPVAIKTLALSHEFQGKELDEARERFRREAAAAGRLEHPNIVTVHDIGEEHDVAYIAMDYAPGKSLDNYTDPDQLLPVEEVIEIGAQVADALDYAHGNKVVHRDIKPANLIYDHSTHTIRITDFGVASMIDDTRTKTGTVLGSPSYMSPEQVKGSRIDGRSDLYSLGVTLYQLLTGRLPFTGDSIANLMHRIINDKHKGIGTIRKGLPGCASRIVNKALQKDAGKRYQSGKEMKEALLRCLKKI